MDIGSWARKALKSRVYEWKMRPECVGCVLHLPSVPGTVQARVIITANSTIIAIITLHYYYSSESDKAY